MNYQQLRQTAQDGDIIFLTVDRGNILSRLTSWVTASQYTHVAFVFWYCDRLLVAESTTHGGSRIALASSYEQREFDLVRCLRPWTKLAPAALARSGTARYGWFSAAYIGLRHWLLAHCGIRLQQITHNQDKACSEYVAELLGFEDCDVSPQQLYTLLVNRP